jgi:hypothetical protein
MIGRGMLSKTSRRAVVVETYLGMLEEGYFEAKFAFEGLAAENVWKRPSEGMLSAGELAGHLAYWEAVMLAGEGGEPEPDLAKCRVKSPLIDARFASFAAAVADPPSEQHRNMTANQVWAELLRVHNEAVADFQARNPDLEDFAPGWFRHTNCWLLKYAVFHVGYHVGQVYSARHFLGETTPDN